MHATRELPRGHALPNDTILLSASCPMSARPNRGNPGPPLMRAGRRTGWICPARCRTYGPDLAVGPGPGLPPSLRKALQFITGRLVRPPPERLHPLALERVGDTWNRLADRSVRCAERVERRAAPDRRSAKYRREKPIYRRARCSPADNRSLAASYAARRAANLLLFAGSAPSAVFMGGTLS
jgi:hypothetical protein